MNIFLKLINGITFSAFLIGTIMFPLCREYYQKKNKTESKSNYIFAVGRVSTIAMMLSLARGGLGIKTFIGLPSELFYRGTAMWETQYGIVTAIVIVCFIFVPIYFNLGITSVYEYLDIRFKSKFIRKLASATFVIKNIFLLGITVYSPSVVLNANVGIPYWASFLLISGLAVLFMIFGNLKVAITVDCIQAVVMVFIAIVVIIQGLIESSGIENVFTRNRDNHRFQFLHWSGDITNRVDTFSAAIGQLFIGICSFGCQQNNVQRYMCLKTRKDVTRILMMNIPLVMFMSLLPWTAGMCIFATYYDCDPLKAGNITKMDAILPFFVQDKMSYIPGFLGLFMSSIFTGALCMTVSNLNSLAAVTWEDFLLPINGFNKFNEKEQVIALKVLGVIYAMITFLMAYIISQFSGVIEGAMTVSSAVAGPLVGVFSLAMLVPFANWKGASVGMIVAHIVCITIAVGKFFVPSPRSSLLHTSIEGCDAGTLNNTLVSTMISKSVNSTVFQSQDDQFEGTFIQTLFNISFMYYCVIGATVTVTIGMIVSWITRSVDDTYDSKLIHPIVLKFKSWTRYMIGFIMARFKTDMKYTVNG